MGTEGGTASHRSSLVTRHSSAVPYLVFSELAAHPALVHGVFTRAGGVSEPPYASLNLSFAVGDDRARVRENRARLARALGAAPTQLYSGRQVHGVAARVVDATTAPEDIEREPLDILLTGTPGCLLLLKFADCTPLLLWDPRWRWVALAHAGWRGTAQNVAGTAVRALAQAAGGPAGELCAAIGPTVGACCYQVGAEVVAAVGAAVPDAGAAIRPAPPATASNGAAPQSIGGATAGTGGAYLDLVAANRQQLQAAGVPAERIYAADCCTACQSESFYSHRALGVPAGRFGVVAGVR